MNHKVVPAVDTEIMPRSVISPMVRPGSALRLHPTLAVGLRVDYVPKFLPVRISHQPRSTSMRFRWPLLPAVVGIPDRSSRVVGSGSSYPLRLLGGQVKEVPLSLLAAKPQLPSMRHRHIWCDSSTGWLAQIRWLPLGSHFIADRSGWHTVCRDNTGKHRFVRS